MATKKKMLQAAAGNSGGGGPLNVEDVFSTYLYEGESPSPTITNGIDLDGEGGLVWIKARSGTYAGDANYGRNILVDTVRGNTKVLSSDNTDSELNNPGGDYIASFNSNGFSVGGATATNEVSSAHDYASWTFRKAPKFFDVVTWTGDGTSNRAIPHNLGGAVGSYFVKCTSDSTNSDWIVWHKDLSANSYNLVLNSTAAEDTNAGLFSTTAPDSSNIYLGTAYFDYINATGRTYVAYLFAHNDGDGEFGADGDADIIKCGSYTGNGSQFGTEINLGFEPQWFFHKRIDAGDGWPINDVMRGLDYSTVKTLRANNSNAEGNSGAIAHPTATGIKLTTADNEWNASGGTYIYIAIRRGTKVPDSADEVFEVATRTAGLPSFKAPFAVDMGLVRKGLTTSGSTYNANRLTGTKFLYTYADDPESNDGGFVWDFMDGWANDGGANSTVISWMWKRAPGFFDAVAYTGNSTARDLPHNLQAVPEMYWIKARDEARGWIVYADINGTYKEGLLNGATAFGTASSIGGDPTDSVIKLSTTFNENRSGYNYIAYLFASLDGISKVGSYTGTGNTAQTIDCGFTSGARFVLIKRSSGASQWYVFDTERGITSTVNDGVLYLNLTNAEQPESSAFGASIDAIQPDSSGFKVQYSDINESGATFIFYAIA